MWMRRNRVRSNRVRRREGERLFFDHLCGGRGSNLQGRNMTRNNSLFCGKRRRGFCREWGTKMYFEHEECGWREVMFCVGGADIF